MMCLILKQRQIKTDIHNKCFIIAIINMLCKNIATAGRVDMRAHLQELFIVVLQTLKSFIMQEPDKEFQGGKFDGE